MRHCPRYRGTTLTETLVACTLLGLLFTVVYLALVPGLRAWSVRSERAHLQNAGAATLARIRQELKLTVIESLVVFSLDRGEPEPANGQEVRAFAFISPVGSAGNVVCGEDGSVVWQKYQVFYVDSSRSELRIQDCPLTTDSEGIIQVRLPRFSPRPGDRALESHVLAMRVRHPLIGLRDLPGGQESSPTPGGLLPSPLSEPTPANPVTVALRLRQGEGEYLMETSGSVMLVGQ